MKFDVIVVGGGSAGCTLASRLSEDPDRNILLIEAGPDHPDAATLPADILDASQPRSSTTGVTPLMTSSTEGSRCPALGSWGVVQPRTHASLSEVPPKTTTVGLRWAFLVGRSQTSSKTSGDWRATPISLVSGMVRTGPFLFADTREAN